MDKHKSVLLFFHYCDANNGGVRSMLDLIDRFLELGNIKIYAAFPGLEGSAITYLRDKGIEVLDFCHATWNVRANKSIWSTMKKFPRLLVKNLIFLIKIGKILRREHIDCIYSNTFACVAGALCSKTYHIKHIWHIREFGMQDHNMRPMFGWKSFYYLLNHWTDKIICISESLRQRYIPFIQDNKIHVVYDDISPAFINDRKHSAGECTNILIAGTIQPGKRQLEALQAVTMVIEAGYNVHLYIAGSGLMSYMQLLQEYVQLHKIDSHVSFLGHIENMNQLREKMDIGLVCSQSEAFGRVTIEGMLSHMAMIGARCAGTNELISHGETGFLYELGNSQELAKQIVELCQNNTLRTTIAEKGYQFAKERFTKGQCAETIWHMLLEI